jgi:hypothetical protein
MPRLAYATSFASILLAASSAHAQPAPVLEDAPPGMCDCGGPSATPVVVAVLPALPRWSIGLRMSGTTTIDKDTNDKTDWSGGGFDAYYRIAPRWELGLEGDAARQQLPDGGGPGDQKLSMGLVMARFHPWPHAVWDLYGVAGLGAASLSTVDAADPNPKADRGVGALGVGVTRRFGHLAISAELRSIGISPVRQQPAAQPEAAVMTTTTMSPAPAAGDSGFNGGSFSLAASYEF